LVEAAAAFDEFEVASVVLDIRCSYEMRPREGEVDEKLCGSRRMKSKRDEFLKEKKRREKKREKKREEES